MKLSASLYADPSKRPEVLATELDVFGIDRFHIDCRDFPEIRSDLERIRNVSKTPIDLHLITADPEKYFDMIQDLGIEYVQLQYENLLTIPEIPAGNTRWGLALINSTQVEVFADFADRFHFVLFMTTEPGVSGGTFNKDTFARIRKFRKLYPGKKIHVDGGVNGAVAFILRTLGVHCVVSGAFLMKGSPAKAILDLVHREIDSDYRVEEFMYTKEESPVICLENADFLSVVKAIESGGMGFVCVTDTADKLLGIISNADLRRGILKKNGDISTIIPADLLNPSPVTVETHWGIGRLLDTIKSKPFLVSFAPVTDAEGILKGVVTFNQLIQSES